LAKEKGESGEKGKKTQITSCFSLFPFFHPACRFTCRLPAGRQGGMAGRFAFVTQEYRPNTMNMSTEKRVNPRKHRTLALVRNARAKHDTPKAM
jgi:hypothetical protein